MHREFARNKLTFKELALGQLFVTRYEIEDYKTSKSRNIYIVGCRKTGDNSYIQDNKFVIINTTGKFKRNYTGYIHKNAHVLVVPNENTKILKDTREGVEFRISS